MTNLMHAAYIIIIGIIKSYQKHIVGIIHNDDTPNNEQAKDR